MARKQEQVGLSAAMRRWSWSSHAELFPMRWKGKGEPSERRKAQHPGGRREERTKRHGIRTCERRFSWPVQLSSLSLTRCATRGKDRRKATFSPIFRIIIVFPRSARA